MARAGARTPTATQGEQNVPQEFVPSKNGVRSLTRKSYGDRYWRMRRRESNERSQLIQGTALQRWVNGHRGDGHDDRGPNEPAA